MKLYLDLQNTISSDSVPDKDSIESWVKQTLIEIKQDTDCELTIRIVDKEEIRALNKTYRHKDKTTNVLSFPYEGFSFDVEAFSTNELSDEMDDSLLGDASLPGDASLLGDIVICHDVVVEQAAEHNKTITAHWAHMVVHGVLHLQAYDHIDDNEADLMESLEVLILNKLQFADPYQ